MIRRDQLSYLPAHILEFNNISIIVKGYDITTMLILARFVEQQIKRQRRFTSNIVFFQRREYSSYLPRRNQLLFQRGRIDEAVARSFARTGSKKWWAIASFAVSRS